MPTTSRPSFMLRSIICAVVLLSAVASSASDAELEAWRAQIEAHDLAFTVEDNWVVRLSPDDRSRLNGALPPVDATDLPAWRPSPSSPAILPSWWDWRDVDGADYVSGVRNQGLCGSCWDFGAVGLFESQIMIVTDQPGTDLDLSEQFVLSCNVGAGDCWGGWVDAGLEFLRLAGAPPEPCFPYQASDAYPCSDACSNPHDLVEKLASWGYVCTGVMDEIAIKTALMDGPVAVSFEVYENFMGYAGGVYSALGSTSTGDFHVMLVVGYDDALGCWIVKNSYGPEWGEDGYVRVAYVSHCAFADWAVAGTYDPAWIPAVTWAPADFAPGDAVTVSYRPGGRPLAGAAGVVIHRGFDGWDVPVDDPMTWNAAEGVWEVVVEVPSDAVSMECVFRDAVADEWDNNGGADWVVTLVEVPDPFVMDGDLDATAEVLANGAGITLWGAVDGQTLYLATEAATGTAQDRFLLVCPVSADLFPAPWAKAGQAPAWDFYLAAEQSNGWAGWFDSEESVVQHSAFKQAHGQVLEGVIDLGEVFVGVDAGDLCFAALGYGTGDAGLLALQAPAGDGDGDVTADELACAAFVPNYLSLFDARLSDGGVEVVWELASPVVDPPFRLTAETSRAVREVAFERPWPGVYRARDGVAHAAGGTIVYELAVDDGAGGWAPLASQAVTMPAFAPSPTLSSPYPNPANPTVAFRVTNPRAGDVVLSVHDLKGRLVRRLHEGPLASGDHEFVWDGRDVSLRAAASGVYVVRLVSDAASVERKLILAR